MNGGSFLRPVSPLCICKVLPVYLWSVMTQMKGLLWHWYSETTHTNNTGGKHFKVRLQLRTFFVSLHGVLSSAERRDAVSISSPYGDFLLLFSVSLGDWRWCHKCVWWASVPPGGAACHASSGILRSRLCRRWKAPPPNANVEAN